MINYLSVILDFLKNEDLLAILTWISSVGAISVIVGVIVHNLRSIKFRVRLSKELNEEGVLNFFPNAQTYMEYKDHGKPSKYMKKANRKIAYVGFWLSHSVGLGGIMETVRDLLAKGTEVTFVLMNPYDKDIIQFSKEFFNFNENYIDAEFTRAMRPIYEFYSSPSLSENDKKRLRVLVHNKPLSAAAFLIDWDDDDNGRILLDSKIMGIDFSDGYGLELIANSKNKNSLSMYNRLKKSYLSFVEYDRTLQTQTTEVNLNTDSFDKLIENLKLNYQDVK